MVRVLVLEDDLELRFSFHELLSNEGFDVHSVGTVEDACCDLEQRCPNVLILDYMLGSSNSLKVASYASEITPQANVLFLTGSARLELEAAKKVNPRTRWILHKPVKVSAFKRALKDVLSETERTDVSRWRAG